MDTINIGQAGLGHLLERWSDIKLFLLCSQTNTFQAILAVSGDQTFIIYLYADNLIQWSQSGRALAGYNAGDGIASYTIPGSLTEEIINIDSTTNVGVPGMWVFRVDQEQLILPRCDDNFLGMKNIFVL